MSGRLEYENKMENKIEERLKNLPDYVAEWNYYLKASRKTVSTRYDYIKKVKNFLNYIDMNLDNITPTKMYEYFTKLQTKIDQNGNEVYTSDSYQLTVWNCLNNFFNYLIQRNYVQENYVKLINKPKNKDLDRINQNRKLLTKEDFRRIIEAVDEGVSSKKTKEYMKCRDKSIILLFMTTGMRKEALCEINIQDIDLLEQKLLVVDKGNKIHQYKLSEDVVSEIKEWMDYRKDICNNTNALFVSYQGNRITGRSVENLIKKYSDDALGYPISPHKLRAGFCSILYNETHDAEFVRRAVGHSNISTTQRYITTDGKEKEVASDIISSIF